MVSKYSMERGKITTSKEDIEKVAQHMQQNHSEEEIKYMQEMVFKSNIVAAIKRLEDENLIVTKESIIDDIHTFKGKEIPKERIVEVFDKFLPILQDEGMVKDDLHLTAQGRAIGIQYNNFMDKDTEFEQPGFENPDEILAEETKKSTEEMPVQWMASKLQEFEKKHNETVIDFLQRAGERYELAQVEMQIARQFQHTDQADIKINATFAQYLVIQGFSADPDLFFDDSEECDIFLSLLEDSYSINRKKLIKGMKERTEQLKDNIQRINKIRTANKQGNYLVKMLDGATMQDMRAEKGDVGVMLKDSLEIFGDDEMVKVIFLKDSQQKIRIVSVSVLFLLEETDKFKDVKADPTNIQAIQKVMSSLSPEEALELDRLVDVCIAGGEVTEAEKCRLTTMMQQVDQRLKKENVELGEVIDWKEHINNFIAFHKENAKKVVDQWKEVKRNDPCPCGAINKDGKPIKYKKCCGRFV